MGRHNRLSILRSCRGAAAAANVGRLTPCTAGRLVAAARARPFYLLWGARATSAAFAARAALRLCASRVHTQRDPRGEVGARRRPLEPAVDRTGGAGSERTWGAPKRQTMNVHMNLIVERDPERLVFPGAARFADRARRRGGPSVKVNAERPRGARTLFWPHSRSTCGSARSHVTQRA